MKRPMMMCAALLLAVGCDRSAKENQEKIEQAQREADQVAARAEREAAEKRAQVQREADEKAAQANAEARKEAAEGQTKANENIRAANQDLVKARSDLQVRAQKTANEIDNKIDRMRTDAQKASPKVQSDFVAAMRDVDDKRAMINSDLRAIVDQPLGQLDSIKAKVDKDFDELKKSVDIAHSKL
jgi:hypothetical protein